MSSDADDGFDATDRKPVPMPEVNDDSAATSTPGTHSNDIGDDTAIGYEAADPALQSPWWRESQLDAPNRKKDAR